MKDFIEIVLFVTGCVMAGIILLIVPYVTGAWVGSFFFEKLGQVLLGLLFDIAVVFILVASAILYKITR